MDDQSVRTLIDTAELMEVWGVSGKTLQRWRKDYGLPYVSPTGNGKIKYRVSSVERWLSEREHAWTHRASSAPRPFDTRHPPAVWRECRTQGERGTGRFNRPTVIWFLVRALISNV